jgi:toxin ParE1/3/4
LAEITWTRESEIWLEDIYNYIAVDDPHAAARTLSKIYEKTQLLKDHPRLGYRYKSEQSREVRILLYDHYRITYVIKAGGDIDILGVFHGALDLDRYVINQSSLR